MRYTSTILFGLAASTSALVGASYSAAAAAVRTTSTTPHPDYAARLGVVESHYDPDPIWANYTKAAYPKDDHELLRRELSDVPESPITWVGSLTPGGPNISITGGHAFVKNKLHSLGAHWLQNTTFEEYKVNKTRTHGNATSLEKRTYANNERYASYCKNGNFNLADCGAINSGQWYIDYHYGNGLCIAGPNACGRFSCSYGSAILLCTAGSEVWVPCQTLSQNADYIYNDCFYPITQTLGGFFNCKSEGQAFYWNPSYNVLAKGVDPVNPFGKCG